MHPIGLQNVICSPAQLRDIEVDILTPTLFIDFSTLLANVMFHCSVRDSFLWLTVEMSFQKRCITSVTACLYNSSQFFKFPR